MSFLKKNPLAALGILVLVLVGIPAAIFLSQKKSDNRSHAAKTVVLSFIPSSSASNPIHAAPGTNVTMDLFLEPGTSIVSFLKAAIVFDPTKLQADPASFQVNQSAFPNTIQPAVVSGGTLGFSVSVGADGTKAIQTPTKVGTISFKVLQPASTTPQLTEVSYGSATQALSIDSNSTPTENVVANTVPAEILIGPGTTQSRCSDNIDNDTNGFIDTHDSSCHTDHNPNNPGSYDPNKDGEHGGGNTCADSKDNNGNNLIDGADPVCHTDGDANNPGSYDPNLPEGGSTGTGLLLNVLLHGIGNSGDNANPTGNSLSNKNPLTPTRNATVYIYDVNNQLVSTSLGPVTYSSASGDYKGRVAVTTALTAGNYNVKVRVDKHLTRLVPGIQSILADKDNTLPQISLVTGDINDDNKLNILDYNLLIDCYSDLLPAVACNDTKKAQADTNDDGLVAQTDYNLVLREFSTQPGE